MDAADVDRAAVDCPAALAVVWAAGLAVWLAADPDLGATVVLARQPT